MKKYNFNNLPDKNWCVDILSAVNGESERFIKIWQAHYEYCSSYPDYQYAGVNEQGVWESWAKEDMPNNCTVLEFCEFFKLISEPIIEFATKPDSALIKRIEKLIEEKVEFVPQVGEIVLASDNQIEWSEWNYVCKHPNRDRHIVNSINTLNEDSAYRAFNYIKPLESSGLSDKHKALIEQIEKESGLKLTVSKI